MNQPAFTLHLKAFKPLTKVMDDTVPEKTGIPERMLCMAILQRAILDYLKMSRTSNCGKDDQSIYHRDTALKWFKIR
jgi:hypothetical protein